MPRTPRSCATIPHRRKIEATLRGFRWAVGPKFALPNMHGRCAFALPFVYMTGDIFSHSVSTALNMCSYSTYHFPGVHGNDMRPSLWGPAIWKLMFVCTWNVCEANAEIVRHLLLHIIPTIIPCATCAKHYKDSIPEVNRRAKGRPGTRDHSFRWCWYMKDAVNRRLGVTSIHLQDFAERFFLYGVSINEVEVADVLVLVALKARDDNKDEVFLEFCDTLYRLLPIDKSTVFMYYLKHAERPIVTSTLRLARATREFHGMTVEDLAKYKATVR